MGGRKKCEGDESEEVGNHFVRDREELVWGSCSLRESVQLSYRVPKS